MYYNLPPITYNLYTILVNQEVSSQKSKSTRKFFYIIAVLWIFACVATFVVYNYLEWKSASVLGTIVSYQKTTCWESGYKGLPVEYISYLPVVAFILPHSSEKYTYVADCNKKYEGVDGTFLQLDTALHFQPINSTTTLRMLPHPFKPVMLIAMPDESLLGNLAR